MSRTRRATKDDGFEEFEIGPDEAIYTTGVVSKLLDIPPWVLKQLDTEGIVSPKRKKGRARLYTKRELKKIETCWYYMQTHSVKVPGLKVILAMESGEFRK